MLSLVVLILSGRYLIVVWRETQRYVQNNRPVEALNLFIRALESKNTVFNDMTFLSALTAVSQLQWLDFA